MTDDWYNVVHMVNRSALGMFAVLLEQQAPYAIEKHIMRKTILNRIKWLFCGRDYASIEEGKKRIEQVGARIAMCVAMGYSTDKQAAFNAHAALMKEAQADQLTAYAVALYSTCFLWASMALPYFMAGVPGSFKDDTSEFTSNGLTFTACVANLPGKSRRALLKGLTDVGAFPLSYDTECFRKEAELCAEHLSMPSLP